MVGGPSRVELRSEELFEPILLQNGIESVVFEDEFIPPASEQFHGQSLVITRDRIQELDEEVLTFRLVIQILVSCEVKKKHLILNGM